MTPTTDRTLDIHAPLAPLSFEEALTIVRAQINRHARRDGKAKLSPDQVREIRFLYETKQATRTDLARRYGVWDTTISDIVNRASWRGVR